MRGNSLFPNRWRVLLWVFPCCLVLPAQILTVDPQKNISFDVAGATAAYSLDASIAEASAENGLVSIAGIIPGKTHIVVISSSDVQTFELLVTTPPPHYPPGFAMRSMARRQPRAVTTKRGIFQVPGRSRTSWTS